jgi:hypothetical protein
MRDFSDDETPRAEPNSVKESYEDGERRISAAWDRALTSEEIAELARGASPLRIAPDHLVYFRH